MDYMMKKISNFIKALKIFLNRKKNQRIILMTTKAKKSYTNLNLKKMIHFIW